VPSQYIKWCVTRNKRYSDNVCPEEILITDNKKILCEWLCKFITEVRKGNGEDYTPRSLYLMLAGLQRHIRRVKPSEEINLFHDVVFRSLRNISDSVFKKLHSKGIGTETKDTPVVSSDQKEILWTKKILDLDTPIGLLRAVFFFNGKNFCLRGGQEQRNLKISQLSWETVVVDGKQIGCYTYMEFGSKNRQGGIRSLNLENKVVKQFEYEADPQRCHVKIF